MNVNTVKSENGKVSCETAEGTVVHININQRSVLDCLLDTLRFFQDVKKSGGNTSPSPSSSSARNLGFGAAYMSLGFFSAMLAVLINVVQVGMIICYSSLHFWVGFPFLVSGALHLVAYKYPKTFWKVLVFISVLLNLSVSIAGIVLTADDLQWYDWNHDNQICDKLRYGRNDYYGPTRSSGFYYESDYDLTSCRDQIQRYQSLKTGLKIVTLLIVVWGLCLSILSLGFGVKSCCSSCKIEKNDKEDDALIKPELCDDIIIA
ncbi:transmembrane protein 176B [Engystomops pustulosus]|uniref:transmembrane protein 176B n=1 Tax=Engystomops pustulosus TaxID=76066 RepID=UPI003AFB1C8D